MVAHSSTTGARWTQLATREAARQLRLRESEQELSMAQGELAVTEQKLHKAGKWLMTAKHILKMVRGDRMCLLEKALLDLGLQKTCYFGHAYIGKHCKRLCESEVAVAITAPLLFGFSPTDRRERTDAWVRACQRREAWVLRLTKWGAVQQLLGVSYDFAAMPHLLPQLVVRAASFAGFVASHFPSHRPTPKELFVVSQGVYFVQRNLFSGLADEEPMEAQHLAPLRRWVETLQGQEASCRDVPDPFAH